jgi:hypothetical protein
MNQAIKDSIAALNEAIGILLQVDDLQPGAEQDQLIIDADAEIDEAKDILATIKRQSKAG